MLIFVSENNWPLFLLKSVHIIKVRVEYGTITKLFISEREAAYKNM